MADSLDIVAPHPTAERTPTFWLINQALELLNREGKSAELAYSHVVELLRERSDATEGVLSLLHSSPSEDVGLRWGALFIAGEVGDLSAAKQLYREASASLPRPCKEEDGCEGPRDIELLVRTMAVEALQRVAERHREAGELVVQLVAERPAQPVLIEAVKTARALKLTDKVREVLKKKDRWMLDIKILPADEVMAEPERGDETSLGHMPPGRTALSFSPNATCCSPKEED